MSSLIEKFREKLINKSDEELTDTYYELLSKIEEAKHKKDYLKLLQYCQTSLSLIEPLIKSTKQLFGNFNIESIPAIEYSLPHLAIIGATGQIENIKEIVDYFPELTRWKPMVEKSFEMRKLASQIFKY